ncbi:MAG: FecR domain-containing protein [Candidatus Aminicenantes bacterium]|nr:FecR domain-containing protein [Candidatus Aminicenantes bacterium]
MSKKIISLVLGAAVCFPLLSYAENHPKSSIADVENVYYGHISFSEFKHDGKDPVVIREDELIEEIAVLNLPLSAGDTILTPEDRRCEIQFDTGTILRLDINTALKLETLLAASLTSKEKMTNLVLKRGRVYVMYKRYMGQEVFQVKTPKTAVKLDHNSVTMIHSRNDSKTDVRVLEGKVYVMFGAEDLLDLTELKVKKEQRLTINADDYRIPSDYQDDSDFMDWNVDLNENFIETHEGKTFIPQPIQKYPEAVFYFAQKYANLHGEWIYDRMYGYVWRPFYNDSYPWGGWQPYYYGHWRRLDGELFWVPDEPWGWVPYHLGVWQWDKKHGWLWIPGDAFAPAWAVWDFYFGFYSWRPWSVWDWGVFFGREKNYYGDRWRLKDDIDGSAKHPSSASPYFFMSAFESWWLGNRGSGWYFSSGNEQGKNLTQINKDQLKRPETPPFKIPDKLKFANKNALKALEQGDKRALESLDAVFSQMVFVEGKHLDSLEISKKVLRLKDITQPAKDWNGDLKSISDPCQAAVQAHWEAEGATTLRQYMFGNQESTRHTTEHFKARETSEKVGGGRSFNREKGRTDPSTSVIERVFSSETMLTPHAFGSRSSGMQVRDWNPDVKTARKAGVSIVYLSKTNEITCPELNLSSPYLSSDSSGNSRTGIKRKSSVSISKGMSSFLSSSGGSSGGGGSSGSSSRGSIASSSRGSASSSAGARGSSSKK